MKKGLIALLVACSMPVLALANEFDATASESNNRGPLSSENMNIVESPIVKDEGIDSGKTSSYTPAPAGTKSITKHVVGSSNNTPDKSTQPSDFRTPPSADTSESPTCLYQSARFSEGAVMSADGNRSGGRYIECTNRKDSRGRAVAIWKIIK